MCDYDVTFLRESRPRARAEYQCEICYGPIARGEQHHAWTGKAEGSAYTLRTHLECVAFFEQVSEWERKQYRDGHSCLTYSDLRETNPEFLPPELRSEWWRLVATKSDGERAVREWAHD